MQVYSASDTMTSTAVVLAGRLAHETVHTCDTKVKEWKICSRDACHLLVEHIKIRHTYLLTWIRDHVHLMIMDEIIPINISKYFGSVNLSGAKRG